MANKNPNPKTRFKKGVTGNPNGRPTVPKEIRDIKKLTVQELEQLVSTLLYATDQDLANILGDESAPKIKKIVAQILVTTGSTGNMTQFDQLLNRVIGKVRETIKHEGVRPVILDYGDGSKEMFTEEKEEE